MVYYIIFNPPTKVLRFFLFSYVFIFPFYLTNLFSNFNFFSFTHQDIKVLLLFILFNRLFYLFFFEEILSY